MATRPIGTRNAFGRIYCDRKKRGRIRWPEDHWEVGFHGRKLSWVAYGSVQSQFNWRVEQRSGRGEFRVAGLDVGVPGAASLRFSQYALSISDRLNHWAG